MVVTPREIDLLIDRAAKLVSMAINHALQPSFTAGGSGNPGVIIQALSGIESIREFFEERADGTAPDKSSFFFTKCRKGGETVRTESKN